MNIKTNLLLVLMVACLLTSSTAANPVPDDLTYEQLLKQRMKAHKQNNFSHSLFFNTNSDNFQQPLSTKCKPLPDISNLIYSVPFWKNNDNEMLYDSQKNLLWPKVVMYKNFQARMRIDMYNKGSSDEDVTSSYYVHYVSDASNNTSVQTIFYEPEMTKPMYRSIQDYNKMTETIFEKGDKEETCQIFQYQEVALDISEFHHFAWKQSKEQFTSYIGEVCVDKDMPSMHAFIGADTTGKQWTAFFDPLSLQPTVIKYQRQTALIRDNHWVSRSSFKAKEFKMIMCKNEKGKVMRPQYVLNNDAPMLFVGYYGILS